MERTGKRAPAGGMATHPFSYNLWLPLLMLSFFQVRDVIIWTRHLQWVKKSWSQIVCTPGNASSSSWHNLVNKLCFRILKVVVFTIVLWQTKWSAAIAFFANCIGNHKISRLLPYFLILAEPFFWPLPVTVRGQCKGECYFFSAAKNISLNMGIVQPQSVDRPVPTNQNPALKLGGVGPGIDWIELRSWSTAQLYSLAHAWPMVGGQTSWWQYFDCAHQATSSHEHKWQLL